MFISDRTLRSKLAQWSLRQCDIDAAPIPKPPKNLSESHADDDNADSTQPRKECRILPGGTHSSRCHTSNLVQTLSIEHIGSSSHVQAPSEISRLDFRAIHSILLESDPSGQTDKDSALLQSCKFTDGRESILHYAIKQAHWATKAQLDVVRRISHFVLETGHDLNHVDAQGRTVVELAVVSRSLMLLDTVVNSGASVSRPNSEGDYPLHTAIRTCASPDVYKYMLRHGADLNVSAVSGREASSFTLTMPLGLVIMRLGAAKNNNERDSTTWFRIAGHLIEHGAIYTPREMDLLLFHFAQAWGQHGGSASLWEDTRPLLFALMKRGLSPTAVLSELPLPKCGCQSLAHLAFFHSRSEAFGRWLIEGSQPRKYGTPLAQCLLLGCGDSFMPRPNSSNLLRALMKREFQMGGELNAIELLLCHENNNSWEQKAALVSTLLSLKAEQYVFECRDRQRHAAILDVIAACPFTPVKCRLAQELLKQRISSQVSGTWRPQDLFQHPANRPFSTYFAGLVGKIDTLVAQQQSSNTMYEALNETFDYQGHHQKSVLGCFVHFVTALKIQGAEGGNAMSKPRLHYLLDLRKEFELPDVHLPNLLILNMLQGAPEAYAKLKDLEKFFAHEDISVLN